MPWTGSAISYMTQVSIKQTTLPVRTMLLLALFRSWGENCLRPESSLKEEKLHLVKTKCDFCPSKPSRCPCHVSTKPQGESHSTTKMINTDNGPEITLLPGTLSPQPPYFIRSSRPPGSNFHNQRPGQTSALESALPLSLWHWPSSTETLRTLVHGSGQTGKFSPLGQRRASSPVLYVSFHSLTWTQQVPHQGFLGNAVRQECESKQSRVKPLSFFLLLSSLYF